jgi:2-iminobutanoate/2-iminopropanoate deaminase
MLFCEMVGLRLCRGPSTAGCCRGSRHCEKEGVIRKVLEIFTQNAPRPAGHYSQAIVHKNMVYVSGQLPIDPQTGEKHIGSIEEQTEQALKNLSEILKAAGTDLSKVIKTTVYVSDIGLWDRVNAVYSRFFGEHRPARAVVPTRDLHFGFQIEIEAIAVVDKNL